jgi:hypothetical protein
VTAPTTTPTSVKAGDRSPVASGANGSSEKSLGELVASATKDLSLLVSQEVALAKAELKKEVAHAGKGAGMLGGAGFLGLFALIFLSIALAYAISWFGIGLGWGFFIVGMLYLVVAGVLALLGKKQISKVGPPEKTIATVKDDVAWAKHPTRP